MIAVHPTRDELSRYRDRQSPPEELLRVDQHLASCDSCYSTLGLPAPPAVVLLEEPADFGDEHIAFAEMERFVDGAMSDVERELVLGHAESCDRCRGELQSLAELGKHLRAAPVAPRRWTPLLALPAAAVVALAIAGAWLVLRQPQTVAPPSSPAVSITPSTPSAPAPAPVLPLDIAQSVNEALRTGRLRRPGVLADLISGSSALRAGGETLRQFTVEAPVGTVVRDDRPVLRWQALADSDSYSVIVLDVETQEIAARGSTTTTIWRPTKALRRGRIYSWQVTAHRGAMKVPAPVPPDPEALFKVAGADLSGELAALEPQLTDSPVAHGIVLAERGLLDEAAQVFAKAARDGDPAAEQFLREIGAWN